MNKIIEFMQKNYAWIIGIVTVIIVIFSNVLKFIEYITCSVYFSFYGLDINLYKYNDTGFIYSLFLSFLFTLAFMSLLFCFFQLRQNFNNKNYFNKSNFLNLLIIAATNSYILFLLKIKLNIVSFVINFIMLVIFEIISMLIIFRKRKEDKGSNSSLVEEMLNYIKKLPFLIIILIILYACKTVIELDKKKEYRIIDENKVIVYANNDYYLTLDCEANNDELIIYKGNQEKINNVNVYSKYTKFKKVHIKEK